MYTTTTNNAILFCDYYKQWITVYKEGAIRPVTMNKYNMSGFTSPSISLIAVLFPAPFFPTNPVILPSGISKDSSSSKSLYFFRTFCIVIIIRLSISHQV